jgi:uncharacterized protein DUF4388
MQHADSAPCEVVRLEDVEVLDSIATARLLALARAGESGELVCSCPAGEAHVYLQRGRVAWANDCEHVHAFTGHLRQHARLDTATIEAVVADCRATRRPIGETLVARGLASVEQVRAALRHQIGLALHVGSCRGEGKSVFLRRAYARYDDRFTFGAGDLLAE